jgi:hypothetical protein
VTFALWATLTLPGAVRADLITTEADLPTPSAVVNFDDFRGRLVRVTPTSPLQVGGTAGNILATCDISDVFVGQPEPFQLGTNGRWDAVTMGPFAGGNAPSFSLTFTFIDGPVTGVGAFVNYGPGAGPDPIISALNADGQVLESYDLAALAPVVTPGEVNAGAFRGILRPEGDIAAFRVSNSFLVLDDLRFSHAAVPEPSSCVLALLGTMTALAVARRQARSTSGSGGTAAPTGRATAGRRMPTRCNSVYYCRQSVTVRHVLGGVHPIENSGT